MNLEYAVLQAKSNQIVIRAGGPGSGRHKVLDALDEINEKFPEHPTNPKERYLPANGKVGASFEVAEREGRLRLKGIKSTEPNSGIGSIALRRITRIADKHGVTMELTATPYGDDKNRIPSDKLKEWYKGHGFRNEEGYDEALDYMVRDPKVLQATSRQRTIKAAEDGQWVTHEGHHIFISDREAATAKKAAAFKKRWANLQQKKANDNKIAPSNLTTDKSFYDKATKIVVELSKTLQGDDLRKTAAKQLGITEPEINKAIQHTTQDWKDWGSSNIADGFKKVMDGDKDANAAYALEYTIAQHKLSQLYPEGKVTLYRGLGADGGKLGRGWKHGDISKLNDLGNQGIDLPQSKALESWTSSKTTATSFAKGMAGDKSGVVLEVTVPIKNVAFTVRSKDKEIGGWQKEFAVGFPNKAIHLNKNNVHWVSNKQVQAARVRLQAKRTESEAYSQIVDNNLPNPKPEDFEGIGKPLSRKRGRLGRMAKPSQLKRLLKGGGPGSGRHKELYHGTSDVFLDSIRKNGLVNAGKGLYVTNDPMAAHDESHFTVKGDEFKKAVGGRPIILVLNKNHPSVKTSKITDADPQYNDSTNIIQNNIPKEAIKGYIYTSPNQERGYSSTIHKLDGKLRSIEAAFNPDEARDNKGEWTQGGDNKPQVTPQGVVDQLAAIGFVFHHNAKNKGDYFASSYEAKGGKFGVAYAANGKWRIGHITPNGDIKRVLKPGLPTGAKRNTMNMDERNQGKGWMSMFSRLSQLGYNTIVPGALVKPIDNKRAEQNEVVRQWREARKQNPDANINDIANKINPQRWANKPAEDSAINFKENTTKFIGKLNKLGDRLQQVDVPQDKIHNARMRLIDQRVKEHALERGNNIILLKDSTPNAPPVDLKDASPVEKQIATTPIASQKELGGGVTKTFKVKFADGSYGVFKPEDGEVNAREEITKGKQTEREVAAYQVAKIVGLDDLVAPTVERTINGKRGMIQKWMDGTLAGELPDVVRYDGDKDLLRAAVFDYVIGNTDRHTGNWLVDHKGGSAINDMMPWQRLPSSQAGIADNAKLRLIDHGLAFPESHMDPGMSNHRFVDQAGNRGFDPSTVSGVYTKNLGAIVTTLKKLGLPRTAINGVKLRIQNLAGAHHFDTLTDADEASDYKRADGLAAAVAAGVCRIFETVGMDQICVGTIFLQNGSITFTGRVKNIIAEPNGQYTSRNNPVQWFALLPQQYNNAYIRAEMLGIQAGGPGSGWFENDGHTPGTPVNKQGKPVTTQKQRLALATYKPSNKVSQDKAALGEQLVRKAIGGEQTANNMPFDVLTKDHKHSIEVKTLVNQTNDKITMHPASLQRKYDWANKNKTHAHTVVLDMRGGKKTPDIYYHEGVGSFRLGSMRPVSGGLKNLAAVITGKNVGHSLR